MVSQIVFNSQSLASTRKFDAAIASQAMSTLLDFIKAVNENKLPKPVIRINKHLSQESFMQECSFMDWCRKFTKNQAERLSVLSLLINNSELHIPAWIGLSNSEERIGKKYCFDETSWALAYFFDFVLFSFHTEAQWDAELLECVYLDLEKEDDPDQNAIIRHAMRGAHILLHKRIYYCHPKHCHQLATTAKLGTKMDLIYEEQDGGNKEAEIVLSNAVKIPTKKQLIGYSKRTKSLYEFQPETPERSKPFLGSENRYHGYPIEPEELHSDVGGRVYNEIIDSLAERAIIDTEAEKRLRII